MLLVDKRYKNIARNIDTLHIGSLDSIPVLPFSLSLSVFRTIAHYYVSFGSISDIPDERQEKGSTHDELYKERQNHEVINTQISSERPCYCVYCEYNTFRTVTKQTVQYVQKRLFNVHAEEYQTSYDIRRCRSVAVRDAIESHKKSIL